MTNNATNTLKDFAAVMLLTWTCRCQHRQLPSSTAAAAGGCTLAAACCQLPRLRQPAASVQSQPRLKCIRFQQLEAQSACTCPPTPPPTQPTSSTPPPPPSPPHTRHHTPVHKLCCTLTQCQRLTQAGVQHQGHTQLELEEVCQPGMDLFRTDAVQGWGGEQQQCSNSSSSSNSHRGSQ